MTDPRQTAPQRPEPTGGPCPLRGEVWYAAFGSNMDVARLRHYLRGGEHGARTYPGCRDPSDPARSVAIMLPGTLYFATRSPVWGGGRAFYDPDGPGETPACAHLISVSQLSDIAAQEMYREPGADLDLTEALATGRSRTGDGRYELLVCAGLLEGDPVVTFTAPWARADVEPVAPTGPYLRHLAQGLMSVHGWSAEDAAEYLAGCPGAAGRWSAAAIADTI